jgi:hypothetical protein
LPKSVVNPKKLYREFGKLHERHVQNNYCKNLHLVRAIMQERYGLPWTQVEVILFTYDLEFFTCKWLAEQFTTTEPAIKNHQVYPLAKAGYLYKHFDRLTPPKDHVDQMFRDEDRLSYRIRYALSQQGRLMAQRVYRLLENPNSTS